MKRWTCLVVLYVAAATTGSESHKEEWLEVNIAQGPVRGHKDDTGELFVFYNIPYATAPTGINKFKAPLPPPTWMVPYDAIDKHIVCPQLELKASMPDNLRQEENCLIANVYVPDTKETNLSVLVSVHGGGFHIGFGDWLTAKNLMKNKDLIVVNFNYRLGIHGFLCLGTEDAPGNAGMKDQVALLRWVQQNIAAFGGNPNDVTIEGCSAGSASVDLLLISKAAEGLFHKAIPESGANLASFAIQTDPLQKAKNQAVRFNFTNVDDVYELEAFYKSLSVDDLLVDIMAPTPDTTSMFTPCIERDTDGAFLTESPLSILSRGDYKKLPILYGFSNMEGLCRIALFDIMWKDLMNENFTEFLPTNLKFQSEDKKEEVAKKIKEFYFSDGTVDDDDVLGYVDFFSDTMFLHSSQWAVELHVKAGHNQLYLYEFEFVDEATPVIPHSDNVRGADHCAQLLALSDGKNLTDSNEDDISEEFKNMKKVMREIWLNFIKTGKPIPEGSSLPAWPPVGADGSPHMSLGQKLELRDLMHPERNQFWKEIYQKYYREPIPPPQPPPRLRAEL